MLNKQKLIRLIASIGVAVVGFSVTGICSETSRNFRINESDVAFTLLPERHITISSGCVTKGELKNCDASKAIKKADLAKIGKDLFGRNPGAMLCSEQLGGTVVWSRDAKGNERTFCKFKDGSLVGSGTLAYYGHENAEKSHPASKL
jgi:hypothetical protein